MLLPDQQPRSRAAIFAWLALALLTVAAGLLRIQSVDFFWHLSAGRYILEHGGPPTTDPFRFTHDGVAWVDHEWGFQWLLALLERLGGIDALVWGRALLVAALTGLLAIALRRRGAPPAPAVLVTALALIGARMRFLYRPELVTLLCFLLLLLLLSAYRERGGGGKVAAMVALVIVWANCHPGVLAAPPVAGAFLLGAWIGRFRERPRGTPTEFLASAAMPFPLTMRQVVGVPLLLAAAILVNPWTYELYLVPGKIADALADLPAINPDWASLLERPQPYLLITAAALALLLATTWLRTRWVDAAYGLVCLALVPLVVSSVRHQGLLFLAGALLAGEALAGLRARSALPSALVGARGTALATVVCLLAAAWCMWPPASGPLAPQTIRHQVGVGLVEGRFPAAAVDALSGWPAVGNLYNSAPFGGYLLYRLYPPRQVFYDTRNEVDPELLRQIARGRSDAAAWDELLARHKIDGALVRYDERRREVITPAAAPGGEALVELHTPSSYLFPRDRFALVYFDDVAMLFLARTPARQAALAGAEYRFVQPEDWRATLSRAKRDPEFRHGLQRELARRQAEGPPSRRARELAAAVGSPPVDAAPGDAAPGEATQDADPP